MSLPVWPIGLPTQVLINGHTETWVDLFIDSQVDAGVPKRRRRYSGVMKLVTGQFMMTKAQVETFEAFFYTTIAAGALPFTFNLPRSVGGAGVAAPATARFQPGGMTLKPLNTQLWLVDFKIRIDPS